MILIVGGAGYIGSHINKLLSRRGYSTLVFDNLVYGHREFAKWGEFVLGDLCDLDQIRSCFAKYPIDVVVHCSSYAYVGESVVNPAKYYRNNIISTVNLLDAMLEQNVSQIIFSSSCSTYGIPESVPIMEDHPQHPVNPYGRTKLIIEEMLRDYERAYGIRSVVLRYFNAAGADIDCEIGEKHNPETHLIPLVLDVALGRKTGIQIFGTDYDTPDGTCVRDYVHVSDLAEAHLLAVDYLMGENDSISLNLSNEKGFSVRDVIAKVDAVTGRPVNSIPMERRAGDPPVLIGSAEMAKRVLGWKPRLNDLGVIIETAWNWHLGAMEE
jgi:UDP-glucose 4-epimerase